MKARHLALAALLVGLLLVRTVNAISLGQVKLKYYNVSPKQAAWTYVGGVADGPFYTGQYNLQLDETYYVGDEAEALVTSAAPDYRIGTYCADLNEYAPTSYDVYDIYMPEDAPIGGGNSPMGDDKARDLRGLFDMHLGEVVGDNTAAAFQACVWEIIYETTGAYDVSYYHDEGGARGDFYVKDYSGGSGWIDTANTWLGDLGSGDPDIDLRVLANTGSQDFALTIPGLGDTPPPIAEPLTVTCVLTGVAALTRYARRRGGKRKDIGPPR